MDDDVIFLWDVMDGGITTKFTLSNNVNRKITSQIKLWRNLVQANAPKLSQTDQLLTHTFSQSALNNGKAHCTNYILFTCMTFALLWFTSIWLYFVHEMRWSDCHPNHKAEDETELNVNLKYQLYLCISRFLHDPNILNATFFILVFVCNYIPLPLEKYLLTSHVHSVV